ncbi:hypothetical protein LJR164_003891 [Phenylobacterium sp. LjRoot164]|uniref:hypothetical protein n=1 Tax=unclassified Phenylobacterium TaxID=2640670 RepID=UPI003ECD43AD
MRIAPLLLILALAAWPANAQQALRGPVQPEPARPVAAAAAQPTEALPALIAPLAPSPANADRCRLTCASDYYACLSTETAEDCAPHWSQCRSNCAAAARR